MHGINKGDPFDIAEQISVHIILNGDTGVQHQTSGVLFKIMHLHYPHAASSGATK